MHPNKHIREALKYAETHGWTFTKSRGHAYGRIRCEYGHHRCQMWFGQRLGVPKTMREQFVRKWTLVLECRSMMPEFYLVLRNRDSDEQLADTVYESGFDDSELTVRGDRAAIWICHRQGELTHLVREALAQARAGGLDVLHVEIENEVFA
jgi:hypothetical protein